MTVFGFHASHEQIPPSRLLADVQAAERAGFRHAMCSDHFAPWSSRQGESGYAWSWLGATLASTSLPLGVVTAPGQRYHPAIAAQKAATLAEMSPGRFWMALGSGQALNEHVTGDRWPSKAERMVRLREAVDVMRALFAGETVSADGAVRVDRARLWTLPAEPPPMFAAAVTPATAAWAGEWADGLITVNQPLERLRAVVDAFRENGGADRPVRLQLHLSYAEDDAAALALAHDQWTPNIVGSDVAWNLETPEEFEQVASFIRPETVRPYVVISASAGQLVDEIGRYTELGFEQVYLHHVGQDQSAFLDLCAGTLLAQLDADG